MRLSALLLVVFHFVCHTAYAIDGASPSDGGVSAADGASATATALELFPPCAVQCLLQAIPTSPCGLNTTCVCHDADLQAKITGCVAAGCPRLDALSAKNASATMCGEPVRDKRLEQSLVAFVGCSVALIFFLVRISWVALDKVRVMGPDDWTIIPAMTFTICVAVVSCIADSIGVGMDIWVLPPERIEAALFWFIIAELFYFLAQGTVKISILLFLLRIFPERGMRRAIHAVIAVVSAYTLVFFFATLFQCQPVQYSWKQLYDGERGRCNNVHLQGWMSAIFNIVLDVVIIVLPVKSLWALQLSVPRKITAIAMFSLGTLVTIISILRLQSLIDFSKSINLTWDSRQAGSWSQCELYVAIICACLPVIRVVILTLGHKYLGWSTTGSAIGSNDKPASDGSSAAKASRSMRRNTLRSGGGAHARSDSGNFIRLDDLEYGPPTPTHCRPGGDYDDNNDAASEKRLVAASGRNNIVVTRQITIGNAL